MTTSQIALQETTMNDAFTLARNNHMIEAALRNQLEIRRENSQNLTERLRIRRALRNPKVMRWLQLELTEELTEASGHSTPHDFLVKTPEGRLKELLAGDDREFDWAEFLESFLPILEILIKLFL